MDTSEQKKTTLIRRLTTGLFLAVYLVGSIFASYYISGLFLDLFVCSLVCLCTLEMWKAVRVKSHKSYNFLVWFYAFTCGIISKLQYDFSSTASFSFNYSWTLIYLLIIFVVGVIITIVNNINLEQLMYFTFTLVYPSLVILSMLYLTNQTHVFNHAEEFAMALVFIISAGTDSLAYFGGSAFGKRKLCPKISPNKTIAGAIFGLLGGIISTVFIFLIMEKSGLVTVVPEFRINKFLMYFICGFVGSIFNQIGDLLASIVKRQMGIKDYSRALGSHGGFMDRFDGLMFTGFSISILFYVFAIGG